MQLYSLLFLEVFMFFIIKPNKGLDNIKQKTSLWSFFPAADTLHSCTLVDT